MLLIAHTLPSAMVSALGRERMSVSGGSATARRGPAGELVVWVGGGSVPWPASSPEPPSTAKAMPAAISSPAPPARARRRRPASAAPAPAPTGRGRALRPPWASRSSRPRRGTGASRRRGRPASARRRPAARSGALSSVAGAAGPRPTLRSGTAVALRPAARSAARPRSPAERKRSDGSLASARATTPSKSGGTESLGGGALRCAQSVASSLSPEYGALPVSAYTSTQPSA